MPGLLRCEELAGTDQLELGHYMRLDIDNIAFRQTEQLDDPGLGIDTDDTQPYPNFSSTQP
jgi:hypothetical protein